MPKLNVVIIDDEQDALDALEILLQDLGNINISRKIINPIDVFSALMDEKPDVIFMDIQMPKINGIELVEKVREILPSLPVVFVTAYDNHALDVIKFNAFDYLQKPILRKDLAKTISNLIEYRKDINSCTKSSEKLIINTKTETRIVNKSEIVYFKADGNYTHLQLLNGETIYTSYNLGKMSLKFHDNELARITRSVLVNKEYITAINKKKKTCTIEFNNQRHEFDASLSFLKDFAKIMNE